MVHFDRLKEYIRIVHHIPGRIRLKLSPRVIQMIDRTVIKKYYFLKNVPIDSPAILSVRINALALSCVIEYDMEAIPPDAWDDILAGAVTNPAERLMSIINDVYGKYLDNKNLLQLGGKS